MASRKRSTPSSRNNDQNARGSWGGKRNGAGRKRELALSTRQEIASDYLVYRGKRFDREAAICELMADFGVTRRMVVRCLDEFWSDTKWNADIFADAVEGLNKINSLPDEENEIRKLKPGMYADGGLMLRLNAAGERQWIFRFFWKGGEACSKVLGDSTISLEEIRDRARRARRMWVKGQNPIDGSWLNADLEAAGSKS